MSLSFDIFVVQPKPIPSAVPDFEAAAAQATWPPSTSTLISADDARRQIGECRRYLTDFEAALERSTSPHELIDLMTTAYPILANPYTLWVAAYDLLSPKN